MMIARPTAASAAATVITKKTNTCPATPYTCAKATKARLTALSISSTHMKMMIALRRVSTPTTPITKRTAEKNSASDSILSPPSEHDGADDRDQQQDAGQLEGEQILGEQWLCDGRDRAALRDVLRDVSGRQRETLGRASARQREDLRQQRETDAAGRALPARA